MDMRISINRGIVLSAGAAPVLKANYHRTAKIVASTGNRRVAKAAKDTKNAKCYAKVGAVKSLGTGATGGAKKPRTP
jgi:hypothetical protein